LRKHWKSIAKGVLRDKLKQLYQDVPEFGFDMSMGQLVPENTIVADAPLEAEDQLQYRYEW
jgi:hypothetical protein